LMSLEIVVESIDNSSMGIYTIKGLEELLE